MTALTAGVFSEPDRYLRVWFSQTGLTGSFVRLEPDTRIGAVPYALQAQEAADADTLDGEHASAFADAVHTHDDRYYTEGEADALFSRKYAYVVVVAKSGGDYTSVQAAINSITDASASNPYLVWVAPGVYVEQVTMKPHVHLQGAGQEATVITSTANTDTWPPDVATLKLASNTSLRDLTVGNSGTGSRNVALLATAGTIQTLVADVTAKAQGSGSRNYAIFLTGSGTGVTLQDVTALGENGSSRNYGLYNYDGAAATLRGGSFTGRGGYSTCGIFNDGSGTTLEAESVTALGENGHYNNYGLKNYGAATLRGGSFTGRRGTDAGGIFNYEATLEAESVTALGENGSDENYGLYNRVGAAATLRGGSFTGRGGGDAWGLYNHGVTLEAESVTALGENGHYHNYGLQNYGAATLRGGSFTGRGGWGYATGIYNSSGGTTAESVTALGENGHSGNYGLYNYYNATANITQSVLEGATNSVHHSGGTVTVSNSRLVGGVVAGIVTCVAVSRGTTFYTQTCP
jgi:hypothetical protein